MGHNLLKFNMYFFIISKVLYLSGIYPDECYCLNEPCPTVKDPEIAKAINSGIELI